MLLRDLEAQLRELTMRSLLARAHGAPVDPLDVLAELAVTTEIAARMAQRRCATMAQALQAGASVGQVATAVDTDPAEVTVALSAWADDQHRHGLISEAQHVEVHQLVGAHRARRSGDLCDAAWPRIGGKGWKPGGPPGAGKETLDSNRWPAGGAGPEGARDVSITRQQTGRPSGDPERSQVRIGGGGREGRGAARRARRPVRRTGPATA